MKQILTKFLPLFFLITCFTYFTSYAQNLTGIWRGYFITDNGDQYKLEFQISQNNSSAVSGVSYSYLDVRFYGKATMTGSFLKSSSSFRIREIKTVEVKSILGGATCIMNYNFNYVTSGKEEFLEGTWLGKSETKNKKTNPGAAWGECGYGKVYLRRVTTSDFYVEPFLRNKIRNNGPVIINEPPRKKDSAKTDVRPPVKNPTVTNTQTNKPAAKTNTSTAKKPMAKPKVNTNTAKTNSTEIKKPVVKPNTNTGTTKTTTPPKDSLQKISPSGTKIITPKQLIPTPQVMKDRSNELVKTFVVSNPEVTVQLYDNGEIDDDTIAVYLDKKLVLSAQRLTASPLILKLKLDEETTELELVMVAENLGRIPPNTSLMIVESGEQRFTAQITSTEQKNAVVRLKYQKPN
jgi:hypothetical protein